MDEKCIIFFSTYLFSNKKLTIQKFLKQMKTVILEKIQFANRKKSKPKTKFGVVDLPRFRYQAPDRQTKNTMGCASRGYKLLMQNFMTEKLVVISTIPELQ